MDPKRQSEENEKRFYLDRSLATGIFSWQEMAHLDFQELIELARENSFDSGESVFDMNE